MHIRPIADDSAFVVAQIIALNRQNERCGNDSIALSFPITSLIYFALEFCFALTLGCSLSEGVGQCTLASIHRRGRNENEYFFSKHKHETLKDEKNRAATTDTANCNWERVRAFRSTAEFYHFRCELWPFDMSFITMPAHNTFNEKRIVDDGNAIHCICASTRTLSKHELFLNGKSNEKTMSLLLASDTPKCSKDIPSAIIVPKNRFEFHFVIAACLCWRRCCYVVYYSSNIVHLFRFAPLWPVEYSTEKY